MESTIRTAEDLMLILIESTSLDIFDGETREHAGKGLTKISKTVDKTLPWDAILPKRAYSVDLCDDSRLFPSTVGMLANHPIDIIGESSEGLVHSKTQKVVKWLSFSKTKRLMNMVSAAGMGAQYYQLHYRCISEDARYCSYSKGSIAIDKNGNIHNVLYNGQDIGGKEAVRSAVLLCGVIEDAKRLNAVQVELSDAISVIFPVERVRIPEIFSFRDGPRGDSGRRKALVHWVMNHKRIIPPKSIDVSGHFRGVRQFDVDGISVLLTPNGTNELFG